MKRNTTLLVLLAFFAGVTAAAAQSGEFVDVSVARYGYAFKIPKEFELAGAVGDTTTWTFRPDPAGEVAGAAETGGASEPTLTVSVSRTSMETAGSQELFVINKKLDADAAGASGPKIRDLAVLALGDGYGYWYKETGTSEPTEIHRWIVKVFGNKSMYTIGLAGAYKQFEQWGPVYEQLIASFRLIPIKAE